MNISLQIVPRYIILRLKFNVYARINSTSKPTPTEGNDDTNQVFIHSILLQTSLSIKMKEIRNCGYRTFTAFNYTSDI